MVTSCRTTIWRRRGISLLWDMRALESFATPGEAVDLRALWTTARQWPETLPSSDGYALLVTGLEGVMDALEGDDVEKWLEGDLKPLIHSFQDFYNSDAALIFWTPSGRKRIEMVGATEHYFWKPHSRPRLPLGQYLWGGAEADVQRILVSDDPAADSDGPAWCGLFHPRIS